MTSIEQYLDSAGKLIYTNKGTSMLPLLRQGKDMFIITKKGSERCKRGDVVLFRRGNDNVLHRIINVNPDSYDILGDNCIAYEKGITDSSIMGIMTGFIRGGNEYSITSAGYKFYTFIILHTIGLRIFAKKVFIHARRLIGTRIHRVGA
ncbi:MAG: S24/S26 family peptidase [Synergistaceae bacterium]|nr:S24/S26 family peptidase [Synergistaceae bacterium]MBR0034569.1 S24/S26 family peptidase [Synergistaceae bacterium]